MKSILLDILSKDTTINKSASRYLYKTHPGLWEQVLSQTKFLPLNALPKQRIWHIINDVWEIPTCPVTGQQVKWWENRYLTTSSRSAKAQMQHLRGDFADLHSEEKNKKRRESNINAVKRGRKYRSKDTYTDAQKQKCVDTCMSRYGVPNGSQSSTARRKISNKQIENGATPYHLRSYRRLYYDAVWRFTELNWKKHFDLINPDRINRSKNALDHIYSIQQGFRDNIPPYIIGHWTNLRIIDMRENSIKGMKCGKTKDQLFDDFFEQSE